MGYTTTEKIIAVMTDYKNRLNAQSVGKKLEPLTEDGFFLLLSGVAGCRVVTALSEQMDPERHYKCKDVEERSRTAAWLEENYGIVDWHTLESACREFFNINEEYKQFWAEWHNMSMQSRKTDPAAVFKLKRCNVYAKNYSAIVGEGGFYGWDCSERMTLLRLAFAADVINEEEFRFDASAIAKKASSLFNNWVEYGMSYLAGFLYHNYVKFNCNEELTDKFKMCYGMLHYMFENHWSAREWYKYSTEYAINKDDMRTLIKWDGPDMCIATNRITVDHFPVGYMYRESPDSNFPDSGWRFYQGMEDDEYSYDMNNSGIHTLNDICNYDPAIIPYLRSPVGTRLMRTHDGKFADSEI